jgi:hypothetical protein
MTREIASGIVIWAGDAGYERPTLADGTLIRLGAPARITLGKRVFEGTVETAKVTASADYVLDMWAARIVVEGLPPMAEIYYLDCGEMKLILEAGMHLALLAARRVRER